MSYDERTPLLQFPGSGYFGQNTPAVAALRRQNAKDGEIGDLHHQFCHLVGLRPANQPPGQPFKPNPESLYSRATKHKGQQNIVYMFAASLTNTLLLSQVVLGAALTGLGASDSSRVLITVFGALNTVIAGLIAFLKSRGQPMRARMFRDDLERVVDEIENSAVMWLGISRGAHGYDAIDTDEQVTVRSEVARLTRLYDRAVKTNTMNDPDTYAAGGPGDPHTAALRSRPLGQDSTLPISATPIQTIVAPPVPDAPPAANVPVATPAAVDPDESPATEVNHPARDDKTDPVDGPGDQPSNPISSTAAPIKDNDGSKVEPSTSTPAPPDTSPTPPKPAAPLASTVSTPVPTSATPVDEDQSPATAAHPPEASKTPRATDDIGAGK